MVKVLQNKRIIVTRAEEQATELIDLLKEAGAKVIHIPAFKVQPVDSWSECDEVVDNLKTYSWIIFTSTNGVRFFIERLNHLNQQVEVLNQLKVAAVGEKTAQYLIEMGVKVDLIPKDYRAEGLIEAFTTVGIESQRILIIKPEKSRELLREALINLRAQVDEIAVYKNVAVEIDTSLINGSYADVITFTSPSTVRNFINAFGLDKIRNWIASGCRVAALGTITKSALDEFELTTDILPDKFTIGHLVAEIKNFYK